MPPSLRSCRTRWPAIPITWPAVDPRSAGAGLPQLPQHRADLRCGRERHRDGTRRRCDPRRPHRQGVMPLDEALLIARQIAEAIEYGHERAGGILTATPKE